MEKPASIENRWDILYRDYPDVYEAFSNNPYHPTVYEEMARIIDFRGKHIADVGSGTGSSTFALARHASHVTGIESEHAMLRLAKEKAANFAQLPVTFLAGSALALPLADASVDIVTGITLAIYPPELFRDFIREGLRVARERVIQVDIPPGWYGGELAGVINHPTPELEMMDRIFVEEFGFTYWDIFSTQEYGSVDHIVNTYGFIFGQKAIDHLRRTGQTSIRWKFRIYSRTVERR